jgi:hypothetical protein
LKENEVAQYYGQEDFVELTLARRAKEQAIRNQMQDERERQQERFRCSFGSGGRVRLLGNRRR